MVQNVDAAWVGLSTPVTFSTIGGSLDGMVLPRPRLTSDPSRSPNLLAVGSVTAACRVIAWVPVLLAVADCGIVPETSRALPDSAAR